MNEFYIGQRVVTANGAGTIDNKELANDAYPNQTPRMIGTGRYGVKLDNNPFTSIKNGVAYYQPHEISEIKE